MITQHKLINNNFKFVIIKFENQINIYCVELILKYWQILITLWSLSAIKRRNLKNRCLLWSFKSLILLNKFVSRLGFEPTTFSLWTWRAIHWTNKGYGTLFLIKIDLWSGDGLPIDPDPSPWSMDQQGSRMGWRRWTAILIGFVRVLIILSLGSY